MTQKITLSMPDILYEKLQSWRASFNLSKLFQDALADAIQRKEDFQKRVAEDLDMTEIIRRLKQEKQNWEKKYYSLGIAEGLQWAKLAHYWDFLYVLKFDDMYKLLSDTKMCDYFNQIYSKTGLLEPKETDNSDDKQMFLEGWFKGVKDFWNSIKEKL